MENDANLVSADEAEIEINPMVHLIAPVAAIVGTIVVRKIVNDAYERMTGHPAPLARDPRTPIFRAILWTALITTSAAVAEVAIYRAINRIGEKRA
jgi:hypothetical protein